MCNFSMLKEKEQYHGIPLKSSINYHAITNFASDMCKSVLK